MDPPSISLIRSDKDEKLDKDFIKIKILRNPTPEKSNLHELKMALFYNSKPEEFLSFVCNFNMTLEASGMHKAGANIQYLCTIVRGSV